MWTKPIPWGMGITDRRCISLPKIERKIKHLYFRVHAGILSRAGNIFIFLARTFSIEKKKRPAGSACVSVGAKSGTRLMRVRGMMLKYDLPVR